jgi:FMN phosphatase YigB (HAD superfamily)
MQRYQWLLFDADGTLFDFDRAVPWSETTVPNDRRGSTKKFPMTNSEAA